MVASHQRIVRCVTLSGLSLMTVALSTFTACAEDGEHFKQTIQLRKCATEGAESVASWDSEELSSLETSFAASFSYLSVSLQFDSVDSGTLSVQHRYQDETKLEIETTFRIIGEDIVESGMIGMDHGPLIDEFLALSAQAMKLAKANASASNLSMDCQSIP